MVNPPPSPELGPLLAAGAATLVHDSEPTGVGALERAPTTNRPSPLPRVMHEAAAAVVLVDLSTSSVVYANRAAMAMSCDQRLPMQVDEWGRGAGLVDPSGRDLGHSRGPLLRVARGEAVTGELVRHMPTRAGDAAPAEQFRQDGDARGVGSGDAEGAMWVTGFRLAPGDGSSPGPASSVPAQGVGSVQARGRAQVAGTDQQVAKGAQREAAADVPDQRLSSSALLVFLRVGTAGPADPDHGTGLLHNRAVIATDLSFTISDPRLPDDPLVWVNPAFSRTTGYPQGEVVGRNCRFLQGPETDPAAAGRISAALQAEEPCVETILNYRKDGTAFWNEVSISPVFDADGTLVNFVGIQSDVTVRVESDLATAQALAAEQQARGRLSMLADVADAMTELDEVTALRRVTRVLADGLVRWCAVVVADGGLRIAAMARISDGDVGGIRTPRPYVDAEDPLADLVRGGEKGIVEIDCDQTVHHEESVTRWALAQLGVRAPGRCAGVAVPGRRGVPAVLLVGLPDGPMDPEDRSLLEEAARRIGLSLENTRLYAREHLVTETLQRSMLPELAGVSGLDVWSYYAPGVEQAQVGGDWYDLLQPDETSVGVVIGDVVGHDIEAAAAMGQLRSVVRAYAFEQHEPGEVIMRVDQLVAGMRIQRSASMVYARLTQDDDQSWDLSWCRAGHLPPLLVQDGRVETLMEPGGPMVGSEAGRRSTASRQMGPGDVLVLYTDGLIERRSRSLRDGLGLLERLLADLPPMDAAGIGEHLLAALGDGPEDDLAVVVVRVPAAGALPAGPMAVEGARSRRWQLAGNPLSIARARRLAAQTCELWGLASTRQAELVVSELVANAVLHGWGTVGLRLRQEDGVLVIEVDDSNPAPPSRVEGRRKSPGGFGLNVVDQLAEWGWRSRTTGKTVWATLRS